VGTAIKKIDLFIKEEMYYNMASCYKSSHQWSKAII